MRRCPPYGRSRQPQTLAIHPHPRAVLGKRGICRGGSKRRDLTDRRDTAGCRFSEAANDGRRWLKVILRLICRAAPAQADYPFNPGRQPARRIERRPAVRKLKVCMGVDEARQDDRVTEIDGCFWWTSLPHRRDAAPFNTDPSAIQRPSPHRHEMPTAERHGVVVPACHVATETTGRSKPAASVADIPTVGASSRTS